MTAARAAAEETVTLTGLRTAVALLARYGAPEVPRADVLAGHDPADILAAMESIASGLLAGTLPGGAGAEVLAGIGLAAASIEAALASGR